MAKRNPNKMRLNRATPPPPPPPTVKIPHPFRPRAILKKKLIPPPDQDMKEEEKEPGIPLFEVEKEKEMCIKITPTHISDHYNNPQHSDIQIRLADTIFHAHRMVLLKMGFFAGLFNSGMIETQRRIIELQDLELVNFERTLFFAYDRSIKCDTFEEVISLLDTAYYLQFSQFQSAMWNLVDRFRDDNASNRALALMKDAQYSRPYAMTKFDLQSEVLEQLSFETIKNLRLSGRRQWLLPLKWILAHPVVEADAITFLNQCPLDSITWEDTQMLVQYKDDPRLAPFIITAMSMFISRLTSWTSYSISKTNTEEQRGCSQDIQYRPLKLSEICQAKGT